MHTEALTPAPAITRTLRHTHLHQAAHTLTRFLCFKPNDRLQEIVRGDESFCDRFIFVLRQLR